MKEKIRDFTELIVWQKAHQLFLNVVKDVENFPKTEASKIVAMLCFKPTRFEGNCSALRMSKLVNSDY